MAECLGVALQKLLGLVRIQLWSPVASGCGPVSKTQVFQTLRQGLESPHPLHFYAVPVSKKDAFILCALGVSLPHLLLPTVMSSIVEGKRPLKAWYALTTSLPESLGRLVIWHFLGKEE